MDFEMDQFYSQDEIAALKVILGEELHYHYGYFFGDEDLETGQRQTVRNFYPDIPLGARVLDAGCGWGGPAQMLIQERRCSLKGITIGTGQVAYCRSQGLDVEHLDLESDAISGDYDAVFMLEVLSHIRNKLGVLLKLRQCAPRLVLSVNCISESVPDYHQMRQTFGGAMIFCSDTELEQMVEAAGWRILKRRNRRFQSLRTNMLWQKRLEQVYGNIRPPGQLGLLLDVVQSAEQATMLWCAKHPLIDIIAE